MQPHLEISSVWIARETEGVDPSVFFEMARSMFQNTELYETWVADQYENLKKFEATVKYPYRVDDRTIIQAPGEVIHR